MLRSDVELIIDGAAVDELLRGPEGPIFRDFTRRGDNVIAGARALITERRSHWTAEHQTGRLASSIVKRWYTGPDGLILEIVAGAGLEPGYAIWVHEGNAPQGSRIYPKRAKHLVFNGPNGLIFAKSVRASKPNRFLADALPLSEV